MTTAKKTSRPRFSARNNLDTTPWPRLPPNRARRAIVAELARGEASVLELAEARTT